MSQKYTIGAAECNGFELVDRQSRHHQWETDTLGSTGHHDRIRYVKRREQEGNECSPTDRQLDRSLLHQPDGWYPFPTVNADHSSDVELKPEQENFPVSRTPSRHPECGCRLGIMKETRQLEVDAQPNDIPTDHAGSGSLSSGHLCFQDISSTSSVHELETQSRSSSNRQLAFESVLDQYKGVA